MKRLHAWIQHNLIYETSCYTICDSKVSRVPYYVSQMRLGSPKILYLNVPLNAYKSVFLLCNSPPLNSMMTFWKNIQNKQIKVFNSNNAFLLSFFILGRLTNRHKKEGKIRTLCKIDFKEEAYSIPGIMPISSYQC